MDCKYFDGCSAPLCPRDEGMADRTWFADEDICRLADVPEWVRRQRKVSKKAALGGYFTVAMLKHDCRITQGMKGIDPDGIDEKRAADETAWFKAHPVITAELREKSRAMMLKNKALEPGLGTKKASSNLGLNVSPEEKGSLIPLPELGPENAWNGDFLKAPQELENHEVKRDWERWEAQ